jgi:hypothetical protein
VGLFAVERDVELLDGEARRLQAVAGPRVHHHRRVGVVKVTGVDQVDLAASAFFRRRAQQGDREVKFLRDRGEADRGAE